VSVRCRTLVTMLLRSIKQCWIDIRAKKRRSNKIKQRSIPVGSLGTNCLDTHEALTSVHALRPKKRCLCGAELPQPSLTYCSQSCRETYQQPSGRSRRPEKQQLIEVVAHMSLCAAGRYFGVSDNAVRKWLKSYELL
jgi:predicted nucleic acid-binding Zn ribbon protein